MFYFHIAGLYILNKVFDKSKLLFGDTARYINKYVKEEEINFNQ